MNVPPEFKNLAADLGFKPCNKGRRSNHHSHAERNSDNRNANDKTGKILFPGEGDPACQEKWKIHRCLRRSGFWRKIF